MDDCNTDPVIHDPPILRHKGKPRSARITAGREGVVRGGGGQCRQRPVGTGEHETDSENQADCDEGVPPPRKRAHSYKYGICHEQDPNRQNCPTLTNR